MNATGNPVLRFLLQGTKRWSSVDGVVAIYTLVTGAFVVVRHAYIAEAVSLLAFRAFVLLLLLVLPRHRTGGRRPSYNGEAAWRKTAREAARFLRCTYPLALVIWYFEEIQYTVNALAPVTPYWFESHLYAADRFLFGELPAMALSEWTGPVLDELFHAFYLSYYVIVLGGAITAYKKAGPRWQVVETAMASTVTAYFVSFICYPLLPARGPWEHPEVTGGLRPFRGVVFTPLVQWIIRQGAVSGGCFPSSHVSGAWGMVLGLARFHRSTAALFALLATGMSFACIYTRYHHGVDVMAGVVVALAGGLIACRVVPREAPEG